MKRDFWLAGVLLALVVAGGVAGKSVKRAPPTYMPPGAAITAEQGAAGLSPWLVAGTVGISNWPLVQPVSGSGTFAVGGTVAVSNLPATQPVSGTFWPATQPVSGTVAVSNLPATQPVSGTFWQATQPVSGAVSVSNLPATQAVSGTFWQATQPVSGTFWQATQPVSGTVAVSNLPATQPVSGTFWQATQPVSGTVGVSNFPASQTVAGTVGVNNFPASQTVAGTVTANLGTLPALTKGTQGAAGFTVQQLKDSGRTAVFLQVDNVAAVAAEALVSYGGWRGGAALTAGTGAYTVTAGKTFRLESLVVTASGTALATLRVRVRALATTVALSSPVYAATGMVTPANGGGTSEASFGDGIEIPAGFQVGITDIGATSQVFSLWLVGFEY